MTRLNFDKQFIPALLSGKKTQTRRIIKPQPNVGTGSYFKVGHHDGEVWGRSPDQDVDSPLQPLLINGETLKAPFKVGDCFWVPEDFYLHKQLGGKVIARYVATDKHPSTFRGASSMEIEHSRLHFEVTAVRVERLNDISEGDCLAEGVKKFSDEDFSSTLHPIKGTYQRWPTAQVAFAQWWEEFYGEGSWSQNPWVWVYEFKKVDK